MSSHPVTSWLREEVRLHPATTPFHAVVESSEIPPEHPFLQAKQFQLSQLHGVIVAIAQDLALGLSSVLKSLFINLELLVEISLVPL